MSLALGLLIFAWVFVLVWIPIVILSQRKIHPKALFTLFFAELWERFSFYGMRALLILYMTKVLFEAMSKGEADATAYGIYGAYGALVYGMPVIGGLIADKILGFRKAIILGGILMAIGHFVLALENTYMFYAALAFIIVGNGFFKPNISSFLGKFYAPDDARKDGAFTIFYMGVNLGAFLAPMTCGYLGETIGWHWGFGVAGVGMLIGLFVFWGSMKSFGDKGLSTPLGLSKIFAGINLNTLVIVGSILMVPFCALLLNLNDYLAYILIGLGVIIIGYLIIHALVIEKDRSAGKKLLVVVVLFFFHMIFWALFEQAGGSLTLFADRNVDRVIFDNEIPTSIFQSINPMFIILLAPVFSWIWLKMNKAGKEPSTPMKFVLGLFQLGLGFGVIVLAANYMSSDGLVPVGFLVLLYLLHTMGELCLSPIGLSMVTKLSPAKIVGFVMGAWFLSISFAHELAVYLGKQTSSPDENATAQATLDLFSGVYLQWGVYTVMGAAVLLLILTPVLKKWMGDIN
ncbi:MAG: peptide MFS transporter [Flavobacteriales bacterium]|nr:peptide MFS transporter [Flavobacteriales bacterium]